MPQPLNNVTYIPLIGQPCYIIMRIVQQTANSKQYSFLTLSLESAGKFISNWADPNHRAFKNSSS